MAPAAWQQDGDVLTVMAGPRTDMFIDPADFLCRCTAWAYRASADGTSWEFVRYFTLGAAAPQAHIGLEVQSPLGAGCTVVFDRVQVVPQRPADLRDGS